MLLGEQAAHRGLDVGVLHQHEVGEAVESATGAATMIVRIDEVIAAN